MKKYDDLTLNSPIELGHYKVSHSYYGHHQGNWAIIDDSSSRRKHWMPRYVPCICRNAYCWYVSNKDVNLLCVVAWQWNCNPLQGPWCSINWLPHPIMQNLGNTCGLSLSSYRQFTITRDLHADANKIFEFEQTRCFSTIWVILSGIVLYKQIHVYNCWFSHNTSFCFAPARSNTITHHVYPLHW